MSGFELLGEGRSNPRTADLSVFVLTSKDLTKDEEKYVHAHAESLFRKQNSWREPFIKQLERVVTSPSLENALNIASSSSKTIFSTPNWSLAVLERRSSPS